MEKATLFPFKSANGRAGFIGSYKGKSLVCMDPELKSGDALVVALATTAAGQVYFGNIAAKGIEVTIEEAVAA